jgi:pimeloyl-ACP methyl ester carboxylesterase
MLAPSWHQPEQLKLPLLLPQRDQPQTAKACSRYGNGQPLLIIHGNGGSIRTLSAQISYFRQNYEVIVMDSRDHGRSSDSPDTLTFESMTDDLAALLDHLHTGPVNVLGWSDGGIEALLLGIRHPDKVKMIAAMAANLDPGGIHPDFLAAAQTQARTAGVDTTTIQPATRETRVSRLDRDEPHIKPEALETIRAPTLVMAGDHDLVRDEHTIMIYHHIPKS